MLPETQLPKPGMTGRPVVIAHRGASGYLPEHTLEAKALAYGFGVDFLEQDVVATRDGELVVLHDLHLDDVTDVAERFRGRARPDGRHYAVDFTLEELRALTVVERRRAGTREPLYAGRFSAAPARFRIATLDEELALVRGLNATTGRNVGIYPEIKHPRWHRDNGIDLAKLLLDKLAAAGYREASDACFVQCFDADELMRVRRELGCELRLVQLVDAHDETHTELRTPEGVARAAEYADGLGPPYALLAEVDIENDHATGETEGQGGRLSRIAPSAFFSAARAAGLLVHAYTFRREQLPAYAPSFEVLLDTFLNQLGIDGAFVDQPDVALRVRDARR